MRKLLYHDQINSDEIIQDYIARLAIRNGFSSIRKFLVWLITFVDRADELEDYDPRTYQGRLNRYRQKLEIVLGRNIPEDSMAIYLGVERLYESVVKICPRCFSEHPYYKFYWRFDLYSVCHKHDINLVDISSDPYDIPCLLPSQSQRKVSCFLSSKYLVCNWEQSFQNRVALKHSFEELSFDLSIVYALKSLFQRKYCKNFKIDEVVQYIHDGNTIDTPAHIKVDAITAMLGIINDIDWKLILFVFLEICISIKIQVPSRLFDAIPQAHRYKGSSEFQFWALAFCVSFENYHKNEDISSPLVFVSPGSHALPTSNEVYNNLAKALDFDFFPIDHNKYRLLREKIELDSTYVSEIMSFEERIDSFKYTKF